MPAVEKSGIGDVEVAHEFAEVAERGLHQKMEMVVHENIGVEFYGIDVQGLEEDAEKRFPVFFTLKDVFSFISPARYVVHRARILDTQWPGHSSFYNKSSVVSTIKI